MKQLREFMIGFIQRARQLFSKNVPNWIFVPFAALYTFLHPRRRLAFLVPAKYGYCCVSGGKKIYTPKSKSGMVISNPNVDTDEAGVISLLERGDVILDIGACNGKNTLRYAERVGKEGLVVAVEASPLNLYCLRANLKENNQYENVKLVDKAVRKEEAELDLHLPEKPAQHSVTPPDEKNQTTEGKG